jgi:hypothetical protein
MTHPYDKLGTFHPITGYNKWCGPAALATILGITTDEAAKRIRGISPHRYMVKASTTGELLTVLKDAGWQTVKIPPFCRSVKMLLKERKHFQDGMYLLSETGHFRVLKKTAVCWIFVDNQKKEPTRFLGNSRRIVKLHYLVPPTPIAVQINFPEEGPAELKELFRV